MLDDKKLHESLAKGSYVSEEDLQKAEEFAVHYHTSIADYLLREGLITKDLLGQAVAEAFGLPYADVNSNPPGKETVLQIPEAAARQYRTILFSAATKGKITTLTLATDSPERKDEILNFFTAEAHGKKVVLAYCLTEDLENTFNNYRQTLATRFSEIIAAAQKVAPEILDEIIQDASLYRASDIHFEPQEKELVVRFRIDGVLREAGRFPKQYYENILNRIKVLAELRIDEHQTTQDGAIRYTYNDHAIDIRVSILPTYDGEKVVMRLLGEYVRSLSLSDLGLSSAHYDLLLSTAKKPFGMIIIAGPTGSGKTTTLYALLKILNRPEVNVTTIEDPVEYKLAGVNQIQVNTQTNLTFAQGLRSIVRQDPDIILVGEVRDRETADISVNAALTGHLLLSTFHANDAATALPRLLDMGVEPFLLASTLELVISQRLVRRICEHCRYSSLVNLDDIAKNTPAVKQYFSGKTVTLYRGKGCQSCSDSGYQGRIAVYEFIPITEDLKDLILTHPSTQQLWKVAYTHGARPMFEDGIEKVKNGITTIEELVRVVAPPV